MNIFEKKLSLYFRFKYYFKKCSRLHYIKQVKAVSSNYHFNMISLQGLEEIEEEFIQEFFFHEFGVFEELQKDSFFTEEYPERLRQVFERFLTSGKKHKLLKISFLTSFFLFYPPNNPNIIINFLILKIYEEYEIKKSVYGYASILVEKILEGVRIRYFDNPFLIDNSSLDGMDLALKIAPKNVKKDRFYHVVKIIDFLAELKTPEGVQKIKSLKESVWYDLPIVKKMTAEFLLEFSVVVDVSKNGV